MRRGRWMALAAGVGMIAVMAFVLFRPRQELVWKSVAALPDTVNSPDREDYEPNITPDGKHLIFTRGKAGQNADLWIVPFPLVAGRAAEAVPLSDVNTEYDEIDGMLARDGHLYFYSDRPGGMGGYDLYAAPALPNGRFGTPVNLGPHVNSSFNDYDPCVSGCGRFLYFSSNRHSAGSEEDYDLYVCVKRDGQWSAPRTLDTLNTPHNEWEPMLDRAGRVLYFTSNRPRPGPDGATRTDYDLYAATLHKSGWGAPQNLGPHINSEDDEFDPAISPRDGSLLYVRGIRTETGYDVNIWEAGRHAIPLGPLLQPGRISPALLKALALLAAGLLLFFLLVYGWQRLSTLQKCTVGSIAVHCLIAWIFTLVTLTAEYDTLGQKEATFVIYTDLPEDLEQDAFVAALFENRVEVKAREAPRREMETPESLPESPMEIVERAVPRPETAQELGQWRMQPMELTPLPDLSAESRDVRETVRDKAESTPARPLESKPTAAMADVVAAPADTSFEIAESPPVPAPLPAALPARPSRPAVVSALTELAMPDAKASLAVDSITPRPPAAAPVPKTAHSSPTPAPAAVAPARTFSEASAATTTPWQPREPAGRQSVAVQPPDAASAAPPFAALHPVHDGAAGAVAVAENEAAQPAIPQVARRAVEAPLAPEMAFSGMPPPGPSGLAPAARAMPVARPAVAAVAPPLTDLAALAPAKPVATTALATPAPASPRGPSEIAKPRPFAAVIAPAPSPPLPRPPAPPVAAIRPAPRVSPGQAPRVADRERVARITWGEARNLGATINSADEDYEPNLGPDGDTLYLTRGAAGSNANLFVSKRVNGQWTTPVALTNLNSEYDEIDSNVDSTGTRLFFYSDRPGGMGGYDLYESASRDGIWQAPSNLGATVNSAFNDYDPFISFDGRTLLFSSNRDSGGSEENYDLYACTRNEDGTWGPPVRLLINTDFNEWEPALSADGLSLYFSSNRPGGHGGYDIWVSHQRQGQWQPPVNLGPGVNTASDELDPALSADGTTIFFATNRDGGQGSFDIWQARRILAVHE